MTSLSTDTRQDRTGRTGTPATAEVSLPRLYLMRLGYLVMAVGLAVTKWPLLVDGSRPWPLMEGS